MPRLTQHGPWLGTAFRWPPCVTYVAFLPDSYPEIVVWALHHAYKMGFVHHLEDWVAPLCCCSPKSQNLYFKSLLLLKRVSGVSTRSHTLQSELGLDHSFVHINLLQFTRHSLTRLIRREPSSLNSFTDGKLFSKYNLTHHNLLTSCMAISYER